MDRRGFISLIGAAAGLALAMPATMRALAPIRLGLTQIFLDNDAEVITRLRPPWARARGLRSS
jgi:hypothetical protein